MVDDTLPRNHWVKGIVTQVFTGVQVKVAEIKRKGLKKHTVLLGGSWQRCLKSIILIKYLNTFSSV